MIAAVEQPGALHVVMWTGRVGLQAKAITYCQLHLNAANGVVQVPDSVLEGKKWTSISDPRVTLEICKSCVARIR